jgi:hypothetical protein
VGLKDKRANAEAQALADMKADAQTLMGQFLKAAPTNKGTAGQGGGPRKIGGIKVEPPIFSVPTRAQVGLKDKRANAEAQALADMKDEAPELHEKVRCGGVGPGAGRGSRLAPHRRHPGSHRQPRRPDRPLGVALVAGEGVVEPE